MVTLDSTCAHGLPTSSVSPREGESQLLTVGQAASRFNLHPNTLRRLCDSGRLKAYVMPSGHRRIKTADLLVYMGAKPEEIKQEGHQEASDTAPKVALLARVSSEKQGRGFDTANGNRRQGSESESDLERQVNKLREYAQAKYGCENPTLFSDIGSGLNFNRRSFTRLLEEVLQGKWRGGIVLATYKDRVCRNGFELVELICKAGGVKLEIIQGDVEESDEEELSRDVLV